jgi:tetratricopeptide (TPR) repeat protein
LAYEKKGQVDKAEKAYQTSITLKPDFPWTYNNLAALYYSKEKHQKAIEYAERAIKQDPSLPNPYFIKGNIAYTHEKFEEAFSYFSQALEKDQDFFPALVQAGLTKLYLDDPKSSIKYLKKGVKTVPSSVLAWNYLAVAYRKNGDLEKAESTALKSLSIIPDNCMLLETLSRIYLKMDEEKKARKILSKIKKIDPSYRVGADLQEYMM